MQIEAFISPTVPEDYVQTRLNLLSTLREIQARRPDKVQVQINDTERFSEEAGWRSTASASPPAASRLHDAAPAAPTASSSAWP